MVSLYIGDEFFEKPREVDRFLANFAWRLNRLYEDEHILLVEKPAGMIVHPDADEKINTLLNHVRAYLYQSGQWDSKDPGQFTPVLCNRIDRFTGGIVIAAKTEAAMHAMNQKIRDREVGKHHLAIARGNVRPDEGLMDNYLLLKPEGSRKVRILDRPAPGAQRAQTAYRVLSRGRGLTLVECKLLTGRTHQIRAQLRPRRVPAAGLTINTETFATTRALTASIRRCTPTAFRSTSRATGACSATWPGRAFRCARRPLSGSTFRTSSFPETHSSNTAVRLGKDGAVWIWI